MLIFIMDIFCETPTKKPFIEELAPIFIITPAQLGIEPKIFDLKCLTLYTLCHKSILYNRISIK